MKCLRFFILLISISPVSVFSQSIDLIISDKAPNRSYLCWKPTLAKIALADRAKKNVKITITSSTSTQARCTAESKGQVKFREKSDGTAKKKFTNELSLTLPKSAEWVEFEIAGKFGHASTDLNDTSIFIHDIKTGDKLEVFTTTVRIRKNANCLSNKEWNRFIDSLSTLHDIDNGSTQSQFVKYPITHGAAWDMAHGDAAFLPWHRAFLLALERELQHIDPMVTMPYWRFELESPNVFSPAHMGGVSMTGDGSVIFENDHPWQNWRIGRELLKNRRPGNAKQAVWVISENEIIAGSRPFSSFRSNLENSHHGDAHYALDGWAAGSRSPSDPAFFLLHAQVDRVWAIWQTDSSRKLFDSSNPLAYEPQGTWEASKDRGNRSKGQWSNDTMWPWDADNNNQRGRFDLTELDWLDHNQPEKILFPIRSGYAPNGVPTVGEMLDYMNLGYCYDNVPHIEDK